MFWTAITGNRLEFSVAKNWLQFLCLFVCFLFFFFYFFSFFGIVPGHIKN